ncbi:unnamed protein product [Prorocentrum cordatum]|uniref:Glutathione transferase n=1 Tax=Prorocentrum cordatum TaxID=2364126 RepID=A0ABN9UZG6_9DINO|nr:unnamed protein product [Polarella glacialis]
MPAADAGSPAEQGGVGSRLVLVGHPMCPFAQRAWFGIEEAGLEYELRECELYPKPKWLWKINPNGKVPVLLDEAGRPIVESEVIVDAIAERASPALGVGSDADAEVISSWRRLVNEELLPAGRAAKCGGSRAAGLGAVLRQMDSLVAGPFVAGEEISVADVSAAPMMQRLFEDGMVPAELAKLHAWWAEVSQRPAFRKTALPAGQYWWWW